VNVRKSDRSDGHRFLIHSDGFLESTGVFTSRKVIDFISKLLRETGCEIASAQFGGTLTLQSVVSNFEQLVTIFGSPKRQLPDCTPVMGCSHLASGDVSLPSEPRPL